MREPDLNQMLCVLERIESALPDTSDDAGCVYVPCNPEHCPLCSVCDGDERRCVITAIQKLITNAKFEVERRIEESQTDLVRAKFSSEREFVTIAGVEYVRRCNK
jgi:hypothetical protein